MNKLFSLLFSFAIAFSAAVLGSLFTDGAVDGWYALLTKPALNPPNWIFAPVWTILYAFMALAAWRVWHKRHTSKHTTSLLVVYAIHLGVNALWSIVFFGLQQPLLALGIIFILLIFILFLTRAFYRIDKTAGLLFIPYLVWVSFATYLNLSIVFLN